MKIIFLNTWEGKVENEIAEFIKKESAKTDIFCLQEVQGKMKPIADRTLLGYQEFSVYKFVAENDNFPQATYVKDNIKVLSSGSILEKEEGTGVALFVEIEIGNRRIFVLNVHGIANPGDKLDNPSRIKQSEKIIDFLKTKDGLKIVGGDFNLLPGTKSIKMFEKNGFRDLIKEYGISTTRNHYSWDKYPDRQYFADYIFLSPEIDVKSFTVPQNEVSDHLPLILEIKIG